MPTLTITDLAHTETLERSAMSAVVGGTYGGWKMPACFPSLPAMPSPAPSTSTTTTNICVDQSNTQQQHNPVGNGSAVFCGSIYADSNQQGFNSIGSGLGRY